MPAPKAVRDAAIFRNGFKVIWAVQMANEKFSALLGCQITGFLWLSRLYERGVGHRQERWGGMRWTRQRRRAFFARGRTMLSRTAKS